MFLSEDTKKKKKKKSVSMVLLDSAMNDLLLVKPEYKAEE